MKMRSASRVTLFVAALVAYTGCATTRVASPNHLRRDFAAADLAYRELTPNHTGAYNAALDSIARDLDLTTPEALCNELSEAGVKIAEPAVHLPLVRYHAVRRSPRLDMPLAVGSPVVLEHDTSGAPIYPREGMFSPRRRFTSGCAIDRVFPSLLTRIASRSGDRRRPTKASASSAVSGESVVDPAAAGATAAAPSPESRRRSTSVDRHLRSHAQFLRPGARSPAAFAMP